MCAAGHARVYMHMDAKSLSYDSLAGGLPTESAFQLPYYSPRIVASKMTHWMKVTAVTKPDDLSLISGIHVVGKN